MPSSRLIAISAFTILTLLPTVLETPIALQAAKAEAFTELPQVETPEQNVLPLPIAVVNLTPPTGLIIPSIDLDSPVIPVGVNEKGEMDVPSGKTNKVGWYKGGVLPGERGSAVLDAHVYAAFSRLNELTPGSDIFVQEGTETLHFVVDEVETYALSDVPRKRLFTQADKERLNLITCAGVYSEAAETYSHRLIVYATLVRG